MLSSSSIKRYTESFVSQWKAWLKSSIMIGNNIFRRMSLGLCKSSLLLCLFSLSQPPVVMYYFFVREEEAMVSLYFSKSTSELFFNLARSMILEQKKRICYITIENSRFSIFIVHWFIISYSLDIVFKNRWR